MTFNYQSLELLRNLYYKLLLQLRWNLYLRFRPQMIYGVKHQGEWLKNTRISTSSVLNAPEKLELSDDVFIGHFNFIEASHGITIGQGTQITNFVSILSHSSHISIRLHRENYRNHSVPSGYKTGQVIIGEYCFIGPHVTIMPNTTLGKGCLVKSHSLVKGEFPDFSIIEGNPAVRVGDTRALDKAHMEGDQELEKQYERWVKNGQ